MADHFKTLQMIIFIIRIDPALLRRDPDLFLNRIDPFQVRQQQPSTAAIADDDAVTFHIQFLFGIDILGFA